MIFLRRGSMGSSKILPSLMVLAALVLTGSALAGPATTTGTQNVITRLDIHSGQDSTRVVLRGSKTPNFTVFKLKNPERLVVDLIHTEVQGVDAPRIVDDGRIGRIATARFRQAGSTVSRFIIGLRPKVRFQAKAEGSAVVVTIAAKGAKIATPAPAPTPAPLAVAPTPAVEKEERRRTTRWWTARATRTWRARSPSGESSPPATPSRF
jgi:hypothetical protein